MKIRTFSDAMREQFGTKVYRLALTAGTTCPNRDGTCGTGGCTFCSAGGSGDFAAPLLPVREQITAAKKRVDAKFPSSVPPGERRYLAYFQAYTSTYGDPEALGEIFREAVSLPEICGLSIATRPDCLPDRMVEILKEISQKKPVWVELGLQTIHENTAKMVNRGYSLPVFADAYRRLSAAGLPVVVHVILGLPGETEEMMLGTVRYLAALIPPVSGVKLQLLHVLRGTEMGRAYERHPFPLFTMEEYTDLVVRCLRILPPETVIHRMTGDGPKKLLIAPLWSGDKKRVLNMLNRKIAAAER
jgi:radical SAM protein (TIGR01212 family)